MNKNNSSPSDGLFTIKCQCGQTFPAEKGACFCGEKKGDLTLDVDGFLNRVYYFMKEDSADEAADVVYDVFFNLYTHFDIMNEIMEKADVNKLDSHLMLTFMVQTFKYIKQVPNHLDFCDRAAARMKELNFDDKRIHDLVDRYRTTGNYWEDMRALGAPGWLSGPKPD